MRGGTRKEAVVYGCVYHAARGHGGKQLCGFCGSLSDVRNSVAGNVCEEFSSQQGM